MNINTARKRTDPHLPIEDRFMRHVNKTESCWFWTGACRNGYGQFGIGSRVSGDRKHVQAHRWYFEFLNGPIPKELDTDHLCRNRSCVNPSHIEPVTRQVNILRSPLAIMNIANHQLAKTHCPHGHPYDSENTMRRKNGSRRCRTCVRQQLKARRNA